LQKLAAIQQRSNLMAKSKGHGSPQSLKKRTGHSATGEPIGEPIGD
jgi:hypothetical protein